MNTEAAYRDPTPYLYEEAKRLRAAHQGHAHVLEALRAVFESRVGGSAWAVATVVFAVALMSPGVFTGETAFYTLGWVLAPILAIGPRALARRWARATFERHIDTFFAWPKDITLALARWQHTDVVTDAAELADRQAKLGDRLPLAVISVIAWLCMVITAGWGFRAALMGESIVGLVAIIPIMLMTFLAVYHFTTEPLAERVRRNRAVCAQAVQ